MGLDKGKVTLRAGIVGHDCERVVCVGCNGVIRSCRCAAPKVTKHGRCGACQRADATVVKKSEPSEPVVDTGGGFRPVATLDRDRLVVPTPELIYVSGPYAADTDEGKLANVWRALEVGTTLWRLGHHPFVPHLSHYWAAFLAGRGLTPTWEQWLELDVAYLRGFDAIYRIAPSPGADAERWAAKGLRLKIYTSLDEVPAVAGRTW